MALHVWYQKIVGKNIYHLEMWTENLTTLHSWMASRSVYGLVGATLTPQKIAFDNDVEFFTIHQINNDFGDCVFSDGTYIGDEWCASNVEDWLNKMQGETEQVTFGEAVFE